MERGVGKARVGAGEAGAAGACSPPARPPWTTHTTAGSGSELQQWAAGQSSRQLGARGHRRPAEDAKLCEFVALYEPLNWNLIAEKLDGRSSTCAPRQFVHFHLQVLNSSSFFFYSKISLY